MLYKRQMMYVQTYKRIPLYQMMYVQTYVNEIGEPVFLVQDQNGFWLLGVHQRIIEDVVFEF